MVRAFSRSYSALDPEGFASRISTKKRREMYGHFCETLAVDAATSILDVGVSPDRQYDNSNYLERWHPWPGRIVAVGIDDVSPLTIAYPQVRFVRADGLALPFRDQSFDVVHCAATIEHIGGNARQQQLVAECARVARRGFFLTTPNRWFPLDLHTALPLVHWMPKPWHRSVLTWLGHAFFATEERLNLVDAATLRRFADALRADFSSEVERVRLVGLSSNLMLSGRRR
jgi:Methyltransferase domain